MPAQTIEFPQMIGASYTGQNPMSTIERTVNQYIEADESGNSENRFTMLPVPGTLQFAAVGAGPIRGHLDCLDNNNYVVSADHLYRVDTTGTVLNDYGSVGNDALPVSMAASTTQLAVASNRRLYVLAAGVLTLVADVDCPTDIIKVDYSDGFFIVSTVSNVFQISTLDDATGWDALDFSTVESSANDFVGQIVDHRQLFIFGTLIGQAFNNTGNADFPYEADPSGIVMQGLAARDSLVLLDNSPFWLSHNSQGQGQFFRLQGYTPIRISNHAVETAIQNYSTISDAVSFSMQYQGHLWYVTTFPTADHTWVYDVTTKRWFEWMYWDGMEHAHRGMFYCHAFNKHLLGSRNSGVIFEMKQSYFDDNGTTIRRIRRFPHITKFKKRMFYSRFELNMQVGVGLNVASSVAGYDPVVMLRWSDDGGNTWSNLRNLNVGQIGTFSTRVWTDRLGSGRDRVFELTSTDPVPYRYTNCYLNVEVGNN